MAATELTVEQAEACEQLGAALNACIEAMSAVQAAGLDPMAVIASSIPPEHMDALPLPLRMMLG